MESSQNSYEWYENISGSDSFSQGDIFQDFGSVGLEFIDNEEEDFFQVAFSDNVDVIVMTQACDLDQKKVSYVTFCPVVSLEDAIRIILYSKKEEAFMSEMLEKNPAYTLEMIPEKQKKSWEEIASNPNSHRNTVGGFLNGSYIGFYLLNKSDSFSYKVVLLRDSFSLPIITVKKLLEKKNIREWKRLTPPYREHLAQAYSEAFSRIGLPINIKKESIFEDFFGS